MIKFEFSKTVLNSPFVKNYSKHIDKLNKVFNQISTKGILGAHAIPCDKSESYEYMNTLLQKQKKHYKNDKDISKRLESIFGYVFYFFEDIINRNWIDTISIGFQAIKNGEQESIDMLKIKLIVMSELIHEGFNLSSELNIDIHKKIVIDIENTSKPFSLVYTPPSKGFLRDQLTQKHKRLFDNYYYSYKSSEYSEYFELIQLTKLGDISLDERIFIALALYHKHKNCFVEGPQIKLLLKVLGITQTDCDNFKPHYDFFKMFLKKEENLKESHKKYKFNDQDYIELSETLNKSKSEEEVILFQIMLEFKKMFYKTKNIKKFYDNTKHECSKKTITHYFDIFLQSIQTLTPVKNLNKN